MHNTLGSAEQTFASCLANAFVAKAGYQPGTVPEAQALLAHCDALLTLSIGLRCQSSPSWTGRRNLRRRFEFSKEELDKIGMDCLHYTGARAARKLPVEIVVIEVGKAALAAEEKERLKLLRSVSPLSKVQISAVAVDLPTQELWTNAPPTERAMRLFIRGLMNRPGRAG